MTLSAGDFEARPDLSFHLCINLFTLSLSPAPHPVTEGIPFSPLQPNFISLLLFLLKTLSEWERLNSDNPQLSTHLSMHSFINLLPVCTSRGPLSPTVRRTLSCVSRIAHKIVSLFEFLFFLQHVCFSQMSLPSSFTLRRTRVSLSVITLLLVCLSIHLQTLSMNSPFPSACFFSPYFHPFSHPFSTHPSLIQSKPNRPE